MERKYFFVVLFLILAIFLSGCGGGLVTPATDEAKVKSVINELWLAINDQNWSKAKSCCVFGSEAYYNICYLEDLFNTANLYCGNVTIFAYVNILDVSIYGSYSKVYGYISAVISGCGSSASDSGYGYHHLQKVGNSWKIYI